MEPREAMQIALACHFAAAQLEAQSLGYLYASSVPSAALWLHSWHPLPDLVAWFVALGWALCTILALNLAVIASRRRSEGAALQPQANRIARIHVASSGELPPTSALLFGLSTLASAVLWVHGVSPHALRPELVTAMSRVWLVLLVGAGVNRAFEPL
jgi:hypothetical protein